MGQNTSCKILFYNFFTLSQKQHRRPHLYQFANILWQDQTKRGWTKSQYRNSQASIIVPLKTTTHACVHNNPHSFVLKIYCDTTKTSTITMEPNNSKNGKKSILTLLRFHFYFISYIGRTIWRTGVLFVAFPVDWIHFVSILAAYFNSHGITFVCNVQGDIDIFGE